MRLICLLRSSLFAVLVTLWTIPFGILVSLAMLGSLRLRFAIIALWRHGFMALSRYVLGIRYRVIGRENMPAEPSVILAKHQSAWETVGLQDIFPPLVFVLKRELLNMPFFGWGLRAMKMIAIDRGSRREALKQVATRGTDRLRDGYWVVIFPEGTRVAPGEQGRYQPGGAHLAVAAGVKVVPVAHDAGECWPKNAFVKSPGLITVSIGPAIDTHGRSELQIGKEAEAWIEAEMRRLSPHRYPDAKAAQ